MAEVYRSAASLSFSGHDLDPDEISRLLGKPTKAARKGGILPMPAGRQRISHTGIWYLKTEDAFPADLDRQIHALFSGLSEDFDTWKDLANRYRGQIFAGLFLSDYNEGAGISPETLSAVGARGLNLELDIYGEYPLK